MGEGVLVVAGKFVEGTPSPRNFNRGDHRRLLRSDCVSQRQLNCKDLAGSRQQHAPIPALSEKKGRTRSVRPGKTSIDSYLRLFRLAVIRLAIRVRCVFVGRIGMLRRPRPTVNVRVAARLALRCSRGRSVWHRPNFPGRPCIVGGSAVCPGR